MALLSLCLQFETDLISNRKVIELLLQLKSANAHGKKYIKAKPPLVSHLLRNRLFVGFVINVVNQSSRSLGRQDQFFSLLGYEPESDFDHKTSKMKSHSIRTSKRCLNDKSDSLSRNSVDFFGSVQRLLHQTLHDCHIQEISVCL